MASLLWRFWKMLQWKPRLVLVLALLVVVASLGGWLNFNLDMLSW